MDAAVKQGRIAAGTRTEIARVGMAVAARAGVPKPDISSVDAFKRALLDAKSITYPPKRSRHSSRQGSRSSRHRRADKSQTEPQQTVERVPSPSPQETPNSDLRPLPCFCRLRCAADWSVPARTAAVYRIHTGIGAAAKQPEAAEALVRYLTTVNAAALMTAKGFEPIAKK